MSQLLVGRVAVVTGASAGLGRRFATLLAEEGASVVIAARRAPALDKLAAATRELGGSVLAYAIDVADASAIPGLIDSAEGQFGTVDILINNAAVAEADYATELSLQTIDRVIDVDFRAPFLCAVEVARRLIAAEKKRADREHIFGGRVSLYST